MKYMRFPGGKPKALTFSYDDGVEQDIKLVDIFNKYNVKGTFNINTGSFPEEGTVYPEGELHRRMTANQILKGIYDGHEVAVHSYTHPWLDQIPFSTATFEVLEDRKKLEQMFKRHIRGMAYPMGNFNDDVIQILKYCGIAYSRTVLSHGKFSIPQNWLTWHPTCHHNEERLMEFAEKFVNEKSIRLPMLFYVWGHAYEFERDDNWNVIEYFCEKVSFKDDVWYATNIEIYDYTEAYRNLTISVDGKIVHNPSIIDVWFEEKGKMYCVKSGETIFI